MRLNDGCANHLYKDLLWGFWKECEQGWTKPELEARKLIVELPHNVEVTVPPVWSREHDVDFRVGNRSRSKDDGAVIDLRIVDASTHDIKHDFRSCYEGFFVDVSSWVIKHPESMFEKGRKGEEFIRHERELEGPLLIKTARAGRLLTSTFVAFHPPPMSLCPSRLYFILWTLTLMVFVVKYDFYPSSIK